MNIELTDRYDGNAPSWLRGCFECEAMGCVPIKAHARIDNWGADFDSPCCQLTDWQQAEVNRLIADGKQETDGWYFLQCQHCDGTGRVSWLKTILRIPRWIKKGVVFTFKGAPECSSHMGYLAAAWLGFKCAFLVDLRLRKAKGSPRPPPFRRRR